VTEPEGAVGELVGELVGEVVGEVVGELVGVLVGEVVGVLVGEAVGEVVGEAVGEVVELGQERCRMGGVVLSRDDSARVVRDDVSSTKVVSALARIGQAERSMVTETV
jgi:uncharacterized protein YcfJ